MALIEFEHVSKTYHLGAYQTSLREAVSELGKRVLHRQRGAEDDDLFWALNDVNFQVQQGEVLGIIGHNGAGKSTALKLLSRVTFPSSGRIHTQGRMAALIELGAGFHPDLTGRENIYLNGTILGLKKRELDEQFSNIVDFAELAKFIDTPIKRYSSGMYVRLAFAVAAFVRAELLLVDEVLSVGDRAFQERSLAKMNELRDSGATIVFVSHNLSAVRTFCHRVLLMDHGRVIADGEPGAVIEAYQNLDARNRSERIAEMRAQDEQHASAAAREAREAAGPRITRVELLNSEGQPCGDFEPTASLTVRCHYALPRALRHPMWKIRVSRRIDGVNCFGFDLGDPFLEMLNGEGMLEAQIDQLLLMPGAYVLSLALYDREDTRDLVSTTPFPFYVVGQLESESEGIYRPLVQWSHEKAGDETQARQYSEFTYSDVDLS